MMMMIIRKQQASFSLLHPFFLSFFPINDFEAPNHSLGTQLINEDSWISFFFNFFFFWISVSSSTWFLGGCSSRHNSSEVMRVKRIFVNTVLADYWLMWPQCASQDCVSKAPPHSYSQQLLKSHAFKFLGCYSWVCCQFLWRLVE